MRKLCPNFDKDGMEMGLETVLEVPIPEEMLNGMGSSAKMRWQTMRNCLKAGQVDKKSMRLLGLAGSTHEFMSLLKLVGSPLLPFQVHVHDHHRSFNPGSVGSIEASTAKYIVQQYIAAMGGQAAFDTVSSMYAVGQVKLLALDMKGGDDNARRNSEVGGFVLWQKNPDLWSLELVVAGYKLIAGSDGHVAWSQSTSQASHANRGPPRPLRRFFQGLDARVIANLFIDAVCIGEKSINSEDCFILKLEAGTQTRSALSTAHTELLQHTVWGCFSQKSGLLIHLEDTKLVRMKSVIGDDSVFWETNIETSVGDYRYVDAINIAHSGKTSATLYRYGSASSTKRRIEETWMIEEVDFNICGLSMDCFLPPDDLKREQPHDA